MNESDTHQEKTNVEVGRSANVGVSESEAEQNVNVESIVPAVITYAPVNLGYDIAYKTRLTGKLKVAEIVQNIIVVMVTRLVSFPGTYVNVFINYLLAISASGICISGLIFILHSSGFIDLHLRECKSFWIGLEFTYCFLWLIHFFTIPSLILGFAYSADASENIYTESNEKNLIFMAVIAYLSTIVYSWDLWATLKLLRKQRKKSDLSLVLNPTSSVVS